MPNQFGNIEIEKGPSRYAFFNSLLEASPITFQIEESHKGSPKITLTVDELMREDGSGHCWMLGGKSDDSYYTGFYRTNRHTGYINNQRFYFLPTGRTSIQILSGPCLEDFFRSLTDGDIHSRTSVQFVVNSAYPTWDIQIDGIQRDNDRWRFYAMMVGSTNKDSLGLNRRCVGIYSTKNREGGIHIL